MPNSSAMNELEVKTRIKSNQKITLVLEIATVVSFLLLFLYQSLHFSEDSTFFTVLVTIFWVCFAATLWFLNYTYNLKKKIGDHSPDASLTKFSDDLKTLLPKQNSSVAIQSSKPKITFLRFFWTYINYGIKYGALLFLPFLVAVAVAAAIKFPSELLNGFETNTLYRILSSTYGSVLITILGLCSSVLVVVSLFQDMSKNYDLEETNFKRPVYFLGIILLVSVTWQRFSMYSLITSLLAFGFFYWVMHKRYKSGKIILEQQVLKKKHYFLVGIVSFCIGLSLIALS